MIFVAGQNIEKVEQLSLDFQQVLGLIKNGYDWFSWALTEPSLSVYYAETEQDLLVKIQTGLHETPLLRNHFFTLSIQKAIDFQDQDREALNQLFNSATNDSQTAQALINKYKLVSHEDVSNTDEMLQRFGADQNPMFYQANFREQIGLYNFLSEQVNPSDSSQNGSNGSSENGNSGNTGNTGSSSVNEGSAQPTSASSGNSGSGSGSTKRKKTSISQESINFALAKASTTAEFVNYALFYQGCVNQQIKANANKPLRTKIINVLYDQLADLSFKLINVPNIGPLDPGLLSPADLRNAILNSTSLGYRQRGAAMQGLAKNVLIKDQSPAQLRASVSTFFDLVRDTISNSYLMSNQASQDSYLRSFTCQGDKLKVILQVDSKGDIFLSPETAPVINGNLIQTEKTSGYE